MLNVLVKGHTWVSRAMVRRHDSHIRRSCAPRVISAVRGKRQVRSHFKPFI